MPERTSIWVELHPPVPTPIDAARSALRALASVSGQPRIVLEVTGTRGQIRWRLSTERWAVYRTLRALQDQIPGLRHAGIDPPLPDQVADVVARLRFRGDRRLPLNHQAIEPTTRGLLGALSRAGRSESVTVQLILGPRHRPGGLQPESSPQRPRIEQKQTEHRIACDIRVAATALEPARQRSLIEGVAGALRGLEVPGLHLLTTRSSARAFAARRSPLLWSSFLSVSDLLPLTGWPVGEPPLPGVPAPHPRPLPPDPALLHAGRALGVAGTDPDRVIALSEADSMRHLHLLGPSGVGKSTLLAHLALADMTAGRGVVVVDPKGDLVSDLLARIPLERQDDVAVLDARDPAPIGLNGLHRPADPDLAADVLLGVFHSLYAESWGPRTQDILHACLLTLARRGDASIAMIPLLLTNPGLRRSLVGSVVKSDPMGLGAFWGWFEGISDAERLTAIAPLMNKLRPVLLRPGIRAVFGQRQPRFSLDSVFTERRILLVNLAKGKIGGEGAQLLGSLVVALLWASALHRIGTPEAQRSPVMLHIDEVQDYLRLPGDLGDALAQARGLGVGFTLAHQHLGQLPSSIREAVLANARSRVAFQLSARDSRDIAGLAAGQLQPEDLQALPAFHAYAQLLHGGTPRGWASLVTQPLAPPLHSARDLHRRSSQRYGVPLDEVERDLLALIERPASPSEPLGRVRRQTSREEGP